MQAVVVVGAVHGGGRYVLYGGIAGTASLPFAAGLAGRKVGSSVAAQQAPGEGLG